MSAPLPFEQKLSLPADLQKNDVLIAAVSGGADSTAMLRALCSAREAAGFVLRCVHVDHALRGEDSAADARFVEDLCQKLNVECAVFRVPEGRIHARARAQGCGLEAAARDERRAAFAAAALAAAGAAAAGTAGAGAEAAAHDGGRPARVLTAHTRDDVLETILLRLLRGAGPAGLTGIRQENGIFYRPLLSVTRAEVIAYLREIGQEWREDASNTDYAFTRNRLRHTLIPALRAHFPGWEAALQSFAQTQRLAADFIAHGAAARLDPYGAAAIRVNGIDTLSPIVAEEAIFLSMERLPPERPPTAPPPAAVEAAPWRPPAAPPPAALPPAAAPWRPPTAPPPAAVEAAPWRPPAAPPPAAAPWRPPAAVEAAAPWRPPTAPPPAAVEAAPWRPPAALPPAAGEATPWRPPAAPPPAAGEAERQLPDPDARRGRMRSARRNAIRAWLAERGKTLDTGEHRLTRAPNGTVTVRRKKDESGGEGFALVLKTGGAYTVFYRSVYRV